MATLTVWKFELDRWRGPRPSRRSWTLSQQQLIVLHDAATVDVGGREEEAQDPAARQHDGAGCARWLLLGTALRPDLLRATARRRDRRRDRCPRGIPHRRRDRRHFINQVRDQVTPGTSALFVLTSDAVVDKVHDAFAGDQQAELIFTNLDNDQEAALREVFAD